MATTSAAASGSASAAAIAASNLYSSTNHLDWGSKIWTFLLSVCQYYWELFTLFFNSLVQIFLIICFAGLLLAQFFWHAHDLARPKYRIFSWLHPYFCWDDHLRVRMISVSSAQSWTYQKLIRFSRSVILKYRSDRVGLMVVWFSFAGARMALLLIMLKYPSISTV